MSREQSVYFFVEGHPRPKQSFRMGKRGGYQKPELKKWQTLVALGAKEAMNGADPIETHDIEVSLIFYLPDHRRRDLDNLSKGVLDAMEGIVFKNDSQVSKLCSEKVVARNHAGVFVKVHERIKPDDV